MTKAQDRDNPIGKKIKSNFKVLFLINSMLDYWNERKNIYIKKWFDSIRVNLSKSWLQSWEKNISIKNK